MSLHGVYPSDLWPPEQCLKLNNMTSFISSVGAFHRAASVLGPRVRFFLWLCWLFVAALTFSHCWEWGRLFSCSTRLLIASLVLEHGLWGTPASGAVTYQLNCCVACGIHPDQGPNPCPLHWQADSLPLDHQAGPRASLLRAVSQFALGCGHHESLAVLVFQVGCFGGSYLRCHNGCPTRWVSWVLPWGVRAICFSGRSCSFEFPPDCGLPSPYSCVVIWNCLWPFWIPESGQQIFLKGSEGKYFSLALHIVFIVTSQCLLL